ncbi:MAG: hypothetical protein L6Q99_11170 [Planctomycetes bacterium]|nr:hypothetical protein [Planctomycetota bacterium]
MKTLTLFAALVLAPFWTAGAAAAQDDTDVEVFLQFKRNWQNSDLYTFDMAYTADGHLLVAFVQYRPNWSDALIVGDFNPATGVWTKLCDQVMGIDNIDAIELAVPPVKYGENLRDRWYVAMSMIDPPQSGSNTLTMYTALARGWFTKKGVSIAYFQNSPPNGSNFGGSRHPTLTLTPTKHGDWTDYAVDVFVKCVEGTLSNDGTIYRATSLNYGNSFAYEQRVAGSGGTMIALDGSVLDTGEFDHPAACTDFQGGTTLIAFEDPARGTVRIGSSAPGGVFQEIFETAKDGRPEYEPAIVAVDNDVNLTCRAGALDSKGTALMTWYAGTPLGLFTELSPLYHRALGEADILAHESDAYVAVLGLPDVGGARTVFALEGDRDNPFATLTPVDVLDKGSASRARVAITPPGVQPFRRSYAWMAESGAGTPGVWLDL